MRLSKTENALIRSLQQDRLLAERVERLMSIPAIGPITALTWALEIGEVQRFSSIKKAVSYGGLCGDQHSSADRVATHAAVEAAQQASADHADRGDQDGTALQPDAGAALR